MPNLTRLATAHRQLFWASQNFAEVGDDDSNRRSQMLMAVINFFTWGSPYRLQVIEAMDDIIKGSPKGENAIDQQTKDRIADGGI